MVFMNDPLTPPHPNGQFCRSTSLGGLLRRAKSTEFKHSKKKQGLAQEIRYEKERQHQLRNALRQHPPTASNSQSMPFVDLSSNGFESRFDVTSVKLHLLEVESESHLLPNVSSGKITVNDGYSTSNSVLCGTKCPNRHRKRNTAAPFNVLIIGTKLCGKTSFLNFLKSALGPSEKKASNLTCLREDIFAPPYPRIGSFEKHFLETVIDSKRVNLTLWDSKGLERDTIDDQLQEILSFIESKFEDTFLEELKINRTPFNTQDTHIHVVFLLLDPHCIEQSITSSKSATIQESWLHGKDSITLNIASWMDEDIEIKVLRALQGKTVVLPIISKADIISSAQMAFYKQNIREKLWKANLHPLDAFEIEGNDNSSFGSSSNDDVEYDEKPYGELSIRAHDRTVISKKSPPSTSVYASDSSYDNYVDDSKDLFEICSFPFSIISPDLYEPEIVGRQFPWGLADPSNSKHCDFVSLKKIVFCDWREDFREVCWKIFYENWRTDRFLRYRQLYNQR